jgi:hypothetical protein
MLRALSFIVLAVVASLGTTRTTLAQDPADLGAREKTELFVQHIVKVSRIDPAKYEALVLEYEIGMALVDLSPVHDEKEEKERVGESPVGFDLDGFVERALAEIHAEYGALRSDIDLGRLDEARRAVAALKSHADPYVAAHAALADAELEFQALKASGDAPGVRGGCEALVSSCGRIVERHRLHLIRDWRACELIALTYETMQKPLFELLQYALLLVDYNDVPPDVTARAKARMAVLAPEVGRPLGTVAEWMNRIEKFLADEITRADPTQAQETEVVGALDKLIELQEARERKACPNCGQGDCKGNCKGRPKGNRSKNPARVSALAESKGEVLLHGVSKADPSSIWGQLKDKDAAAALQGFRGKLPPRYERLLEQYYKGLTKTE